jgi:hypothetical protein
MALLIKAKALTPEGGGGRQLNFRQESISTCLGTIPEAFECNIEHIQYIRASLRHRFNSKNTQAIFVVPIR